MSHKTVVIISIILFLTSQVSSIFAMDSDTYRIRPDVLDESGGYSSSENYMIWHNLGESPTGPSQSETYRINSGFWQDETPYLSFSISLSVLNFGHITDSAVSTQNTTLTVSTNAVLGYSVQAYDDTPVGINYGMVDGTKKIADATLPNNYIDLPSAGVEHYGVKVTGTHAAVGYASGTKINSLNNESQTEVGSYNSFISGDILSVEYRASISNLSPASSNYQTITTYICTGNF
jgi:hypothetical protein